MRTTILLLLSFCLLSCGPRTKNVQKETTDIETNLDISNQVNSDLKLKSKDKFLETEDQTKMRLKITSKAPDKGCPTEKMIITDKVGNKTEIPINPSSDIEFGKEDVSLQRLHEAESELVEAKNENLKLQLSNKELRENLQSHTERKGFSPWLIALLLAIAYIGGILTRPLIRTFILSKLKAKI